MTTLYLVRHGEVHNPQGVIYGRLPGYGLSDRGREQLERAAEALAPTGSFDRLCASPLQRACESAAILSARLTLDVVVDDSLIETRIEGYQGQPYAALPQPYLTEDPTHAGIESAGSMRQRIVGWADAARRNHPTGRLIAVSHRDPIGVALLHWMGRPLEHLDDLGLEPGSVYEVTLGDGPGTVDVRRLA